jgi:hypothetical protein
MIGDYHKVNGVAIRYWTWPPGAPPVSGWPYLHGAQGMHRDLSTGCRPANTRRRRRPRRHRRIPVQPCSDVSGAATTTGVAVSGERCWNSLLYGVSGGIWLRVISSGRRSRVMASGPQIIVDSRWAESSFFVGRDLTEPPANPNAVSTRDCFLGYAVFARNSDAQGTVAVPGWT